ncbi:MAG: PhnD/SsuA/transferrin family substrate-binding protein [Ilumatobacteraceae bacterium]|nr:PhnD/SsuA/transferrin family substrate-binding protein [Ilumatobacteraceae bacterium]
MTIASLAMYPFTHLQSAHERLWDDVRSRLSFEAPVLSWDVDPDVASRREDLLLGQTCGWPLVKDLAQSVHVVGTFDCDVEGAADGTYRSVLVSNVDDPLSDIMHRADLRVAANSRDSLSGWISLLSVAAAEGVELGAVEWTGAHAISIEAVRDGRCQLACIDAVSLAHLGGRGLSIVGHGPRIPCLPLVASRSVTDAVVSELRGALAASVSDSAMTATCATLKIRGFLERDLADYEGVSDLVELW